MIMNNNLKNIISVLLLINTYLFSANQVVFAMTPAKDDINIYVKSYGEIGYYLDVLTEENDEYYYLLPENISKNLTSLNLYKYRDGNWMAHFIRGGRRFNFLEDSLLGENTSLRNVKFHRFSDVFFRGASMKVIVQMPDNNLIISNPVKFDHSKVYIFDLKTKSLEVINPYYLMYISKSFPILAVIFSIVFSLVIKLLISLVFGICRKIYVVFISTINQVMLYFIMYLLICNRIFNWVSIVFISVILIQTCVEYLAYRRFLEDTISLSKKLSFVIISNILIIPFGWIFLS